jgi:hypothetical protein
MPLEEHRECQVKPANAWLAHGGQQIQKVTEW